VDTGFMETKQPVLRRAAAINAAMQRRFRRMSESGARVGGAGRFFDHHELPVFHRLKNELLQGDSDAAGRQLDGSVETLARLADKLTELMLGLGERELPPLDVLGQLPEFA